MNDLVVRSSDRKEKKKEKERNLQGVWYDRSPVGDIS